jgi:hypothetical protein
MSVLNLRNVSIGILATGTMDILSGGAYKVQLIAPLSPRLIGRWFALVARGQPFQSDIGQLPPVIMKWRSWSRCIMQLGSLLPLDIYS